MQKINRKINSSSRRHLLHFHSDYQHSQHPVLSFDVISPDIAYRTQSKFAQRQLVMKYQWGNLGQSETKNHFILSDIIIIIIRHWLSLYAVNGVSITDSLLFLSLCFYILAFIVCYTRCSDGFDRHRQKWLSSGCNKSEIFEVSYYAVYGKTRQSRRYIVVNQQTEHSRRSFK